jgi:hypothetical protein
MIAISRAVVMFLSFISSPLNAETDIAMSWDDSSRRLALTMISSIEVVLATGAAGACAMDSEAIKQAGISSRSDLQLASDSDLCSFRNLLIASSLNGNTSSIFIPLKIGSAFFVLGND